MAHTLSKDGYVIDTSTIMPRITSESPGQILDLIIRRLQEIRANSGAIESLSGGLITEPWGIRVELDITYADQTIEVEKVEVGKTTPKYILGIAGEDLKEGDVVSIDLSSYFLEGVGSFDSPGIRRSRQTSPDWPLAFIEPKNTGQSHDQVSRKRNKHPKSRT